MERGDGGGEFARALGRHGGVLAAERDRKRHREPFGEEERAAGAVFVLLRLFVAAEARGDGTLELVVRQVVRERVERRHAADLLGMARGEGERGRAAHRAAAEEDAPAKTPCEDVEQLERVGLGRRSHPRGLRAVVGRNKRHAAFRRRVSDGLALAAFLADLRTVAAMAVKVDEHVNRPRHALRRRQQILLLRAVNRRRERAVLERGRACGDACCQNRCDNLHGHYSTT